MTIGIGARGPNAGLAIFRALRAAEDVATGSIGGFVYFAAIGADGRLHVAETQRGGTRTLFTKGEQTGAPPPDEVAAASVAALISSGPDRPNPLSQFIATDPAVGLVTGHRLPNTIGRDGRPLNQAVLALMAEGADTATALDAVFRREPDADAGLIALGARTGLAARNSSLVAQRPDLGAARMESPSGAAVEVLHNAIAPRDSLAPLVAEIALSVISPASAPAGEITVSAGIPVLVGSREQVFVDDVFAVQRIETRNARLASGRHNSAAVYLGAEVVRAGAVIGATMIEPNVIVEDGRVVSLNGRPSFCIPFGDSPKRGADSPKPPSDSPAAGQQNP